MKKELLQLKRNSQQHRLLYCVALYQYRNDEGCTTGDIQNSVNFFKSRGVISGTLCNLRTRGFLDVVTKRKNDSYVNVLSKQGERQLRELGEPDTLPDGSGWDTKTSIREMIGNGQEIFENEKEIVRAQPVRHKGEEKFNGIEDCELDSKEEENMSQTTTFGLPDQETLVEQFEERGLSLYAEAIEEGTLTVSELYNLVENLQ